MVRDSLTVPYQKRMEVVRKTRYRKNIQ